MEYLDEMKSDDNSEWLDEALDCNKANVGELELIKDNLLLSLEQYDELVESYAEELEESDFLEEKDLLIEYYERPPSELGRWIKARRNDHGLPKCPFCGYPFSPDTLDHFIPKNCWPEYSIHVNNLVPQCRGCAPSKGEKYFGEEIGRTYFIHPIYSDLLSKVKFIVNVEFYDGMTKPNFQVRIVTTCVLNDDSKERIKTHLVELKVKSRIVRFCEREFKAWKVKISSRSFDIVRALNQRLDELPIEHLDRDWKSSLYKGILENELLVNYLNSIRPAEEPAEQNHANGVNEIIV